MKKEIKSSAMKPQVVYVPKNILNDYDKFQNLHQELLNKLGCSECTSGLDLRFKELVSSYVVDEMGSINEIQDFKGLKDSFNVTNTFGR